MMMIGSQGSVTPPESLYLNCSVSELNFGSEISSQTFEIESNVGWTISLEDI